MTENAKKDEENKPEDTTAITPYVDEPDPRALALKEREYARSLEPNTWKELRELCADIAANGMFKVANPTDAMLRIMAGRELGVSAVTALSNAFTIDGRVGWYAEFMHARVLTLPDCEYFEPVEQPNAEKASYRTKRRGRPELIWTYTVKDAERDGLMDRAKQNKDKSAWSTAIPDMLSARCKSKLIRAYWPEATKNHPLIEELQDSPRTIDVETVQSRDTKAEVQSLKDSILAVAVEDLENQKALRAQIMKSDLPSRDLQEVKDFYTARFGNPPPPKQPKKEPAKEAAPPALTEPAK